MTRAKTVFVTLLSVCIATAGAVAYASSSGKASNAHYAVFRRDARPIDRLTQDGRKLARHEAQKFNIHPKDSRRTRLKTGHGVWLIPGKDAVCLIVEQKQGPVRGSCNQLSGALTGALYLTDYRRGKVRSFRKITGALPDNGGKVRLVGAGGRDKKLALRNNTYSAHLSKEASANFKPKRVTYEVGGKPYSIPLAH
jgi:hypothetical protein